MLMCARPVLYLSAVPQYYRFLGYKQQWIQNLHLALLLDVTFVCCGVSFSTPLSASEQSSLSRLLCESSTLGAKSEDSVSNENKLYILVSGSKGDCVVLKLQEVPGNGWFLFAGLIIELVYGISKLVSCSSPLDSPRIRKNTVEQFQYFLSMCL